MAAEANGRAVKVKAARGRGQLVLWLFLAMLSISCLYRYLAYRDFAAERLVVDEVKGEELADRVNPNKASWASLARLPGVGPARARAIVGYREKYWEAEGGEGVPFGCGEDLMRVKGIGPSIVAQIEDYLIFDGS